MKNKMRFCCISVLGGWQTGVWFDAGITLAAGAEMSYPIGPIFNKTTDLWAWQGENLPNQTPQPKVTP